MGPAAHIALFAAYAAGAAALAMAGAVFADMETGTAILFGAVAFLTAALLHEHRARKQGEAMGMRRLLLLKRAYDRTVQETAIARDEIRRLFETLEAEGGEELASAIERAGAARARALEEDENFFADEAARRDASPLTNATGETDPETQAELRVLHQLVEQLYADDEDPSTGRTGKRKNKKGSLSSNRETARHEPKLDRPARPDLRVVADEGPNNLSEERILEIVREGLREDRVDLYLQPIVSLPQRKTRYYECFSRIRANDGTVVTPDQYVEPARKAGLLTAVDNMLLFRCVQLVRKAHRADSKASFFCNVSAQTLSDREFFRDFIAFMENHRELTGNLVLEMTQDDFNAQRGRLEPDLKRLAEMGYRFSLDGIDALDLDLASLTSLNVQFVKIDAALILETLAAEGEAATQLRMLKQQLDSHEIDLIVERIETERMLVELLDFNIDFGQGYLFGEPKRTGGDGESKAEQAGPN